MASIGVPRFLALRRLPAARRESDAAIVPFVLAGRSGWETRDGALVLFLCFREQLEAVTAGAIVYDAGCAGEAKGRLKQRRAVVMGNK